MKIKLLLVFIAISKLFAQDTSFLKIQYGDYFSVPKGYVSEYYAKYEKQGYILVSHDEKGNFLLQKFDTALKLQSQKDINIKTTFDKKLEFDNLFYFNKKWYISLVDKSDSKKVKNYTCEIDFKNNDILAPRLMYIGDKIRFDFKEYNDFDSTQLDFFILYKNEFDKQKIGIRSFDKDMKLIIEKDYSFPFYITELYGFASIRSGNHFFLYCKTQDLSTKEFAYELYDFDVTAERNKVYTINFDIPQNNLSNVSLSIDSAQNVVLTGLFGVKLTSPNYMHDYVMYYRDIITLMLDKKNNKIVPYQEGIYSVPDSLYFEMESDSTTRVGRQIQGYVQLGSYLHAFKCNFLIIDNNNDKVILFDKIEQKFNVDELKTINSYIVQKINAAGETEWYTKIPKALAYFSNPIYDNASLLKNNDFYYYIFNDKTYNISNKKTTFASEYKENSKSTLVVVKVSKKNGEWQRQTAIPNEEKIFSIINMQNLSWESIIGKEIIEKNKNYNRRAYILSINN